MKYDIEKKLAHIFVLLKEAKFIEMMKLYLHEYAVIQEADGQHQFGKLTSIKNRQKFMDDHFKELVRYDIGNYAIRGNCSFYEAIVEIKLKDSTTVILEQAVTTAWRDGKIFRERYYYKPIKLKSLNKPKKDINHGVGN